VDPPAWCPECRDHAVNLYNRLLAAGSAPAVGQIPGWMLVKDGEPPADGQPQVLIPERAEFGIVADYNLWTAETLGETKGGFEAWMKLTPDFVQRIGRDAPLLPRELIVQLVRNPQQLALGGLVAKHLNQMFKGDRNYDTLPIASVQDQLGQNGMAEHRRPHHTTKAMTEVGIAYARAATQLGRPGAAITWEPVTYKGKAAIRLYRPEQRLLDLREEPK
jgi:hypothetical protein